MNSKLYIMNIQQHYNNSFTNINEAFPNIHESFANVDEAFNTINLTETTLVHINYTQPSTLAESNYTLIELDNNNLYVVRSCVDNIKDLMINIFEMLDYNDIKIDKLTNLQYNKLGQILNTYFNGLINTSKDTFYKNLETVNNFYNFISGLESVSKFNDILDSIKTTLKEPKQQHKNINSHEHITNGLRINENHETYTTYCKICNSKFTIKKDIDVGYVLYYDSNGKSLHQSLPQSVPIVNSSIENPVNKIDIIFMKTFKKALVLIDISDDSINILCNCFDDIIHVYKNDKVNNELKIKIEDTIHLGIFLTENDIKIKLDELKLVDSTEADLIKSFILNNYELNIDETNRINATILQNQIIEGIGLNINMNRHGFIKRIATYLNELNIKKKRLQDGIYYIGIKKH